MARHGESFPGPTRQLLTRSKGDEIYDGEPKHFELQYKADIALGEHPPKIICDVYSSKADNPPPRPHTNRHPVPSMQRDFESQTRIKADNV